MDGVSLNLRRFVRHAQNVLSQPKNDTEITGVLTCLLHLASTTTGSQYCKELAYFDIKLDTFCMAREEFCKRYYVNIMEFLMDRFTTEWISLLAKNDNSLELLHQIFLAGPPHLSLMVLSESIISSSVSYKLNKCIDLLQQLLLLHIEDLLWNQCQVAKEDLVRQLWPDIIIFLVTIPDRVTAKQRDEASSFFYPTQYVPFLCQAIFKCLHKVHDNIQHDRSCSVEFLSQFIGKLAITGYKEILWENLLPCIESHLYDDAIWCRICEHLVNQVPDRCLESVIVPLVEQASWYGTIGKFLGDSVLFNQKLRFLLTNKLLLVRQYQQNKIPQNILGYLSNSPRTKHLLIQALHNIIDVWGDASVLKHTSYEKHLYLSKAMLVCLAFVEDVDKAKLKTELLPKLMTALQCHLESALPKIRQLGMVVAECLTSTLDPDGEKLEFKYDADNDIKQLKQLLIKPTNPSMGTAETELPKQMNTCGEESIPELLVRETEDTEELDSDDDLEPYDMSEDVKVTKFKKPVYLRDCMEGLISSNDPEHIEMCIMIAESLIYRHAASVTEIAVEFTKVLLYLQDNYIIHGFTLARHKAMVALTCVAPEKVAEYLGNEFYARNYNTRQRIDMLEVLSEAAQKLSNPSDKIIPEDLVPKMKLVQEVEPEKSEPESWQDIIGKRIAAKTRHFAKARHGPEPAESANRFAPVAGYFFFPLLQVFDRRDDTVDILGDDHLLLTRLCYTLGIIMYSALNAPIVRQMSKSMTEFIWTLRYHSQPAVRQSLLFAVSMMLLAVPSHMLFSDLQTEMIDMKDWIGNVIEKDSDNDCKKLAIQAMVLLMKSFKQEYSCHEESS